MPEPGCCWTRSSTQRAVFGLRQRRCIAARATLTPPQFKYDIFITPSVLSRRTEAFPVGGGWSNTWVGVEVGQEVDVGQEVVIHQLVLSW